MFQCTMPANLRYEAIRLGKIGNHTASLTPSEISALSKVLEPHHITQFIHEASLLKISDHRRSRDSSNLSQLLCEIIHHASLPPHISQQRLPLHCLRSNGSNDQLLGRHHRSHPSAVLSRSIFVGPARQPESYLSKRICCLSKRLCYQFDLGRRCAWPTDAPPVDTADAFVQENSCHGRFQYGRCVSIHFSHCVRKRAAIAFVIHLANLSNSPTPSSHSVCIITILRIISLLHLSFSDLSYSLLPATIWGCLEPCLGIVSACMPVLPPLLARMFKCTNTLTWLRINRPSTTLSPTTYNTSTWPRGSACTPIATTTPVVRSLRCVPRKQRNSVTKFHRLYDVGNLLGTPPPPPPGKAALLPRLLVDDEDEGWSCTEMENQSDPEELRNIRISKGWHRSRAGTFAPPGSPRG